MAEAHTDRVQRIAAEVLASTERPIAVYGLAYVRFACCDAPAHARAWAVEEVKVAARMWEAMVAGGALAADWLATPGRQFACPVCFRRRRHDRIHHHHETCPACHAAPLLAPPTCEGVVTIASAKDAVIVAEQNARDLAAALVPWGAREIATIVWRIRETPRPVAPVPLRLAAAAGAVATRAPGAHPRSITSDDDRRAAWRDAVVADAQMPPHPRRREPWPPTGARFRSFADPFERFDTIRAAGAVLEDLTADDAVLAMRPIALVGERFADLLELHDRAGTRPASWR